MIATRVGSALLTVATEANSFPPLIEALIDRRASSKEGFGEDDLGLLGASPE